MLEQQKGENNDKWKSTTSYVTNYVLERNGIDIKRGNWRAERDEEAA